MSAPEAWVQCARCGASGYVIEPANNVAGESLRGCPDCSDGLVPSDGEIEAAADALLTVVYLGAGRDELGITQIRMHELAAKAALVAARRYQREAVEL